MGLLNISLIEKLAVSLDLLRHDTLERMNYKSGTTVLEETAF